MLLTTLIANIHELMKSRDRTFTRGELLLEIARRMVWERRHGEWLSLEKTYDVQAREAALVLSERWRTSIHGVERDTVFLRAAIQYHDSFVI